MTPARRHRERALAALQTANLIRPTTRSTRAAADAAGRTPPHPQEHPGIERKIDAKRTMLPVYKPWIDGVLAADRGGQDDVLVTVMLWTLGTPAIWTGPSTYGRLRDPPRPGAPRINTTALPPTLIAEEMADTGIKLQEAGAGPNLGLLCALPRAPDQLRHLRPGARQVAQGRGPRSTGRRLQGNKPPRHYQRAIRTARQGGHQERARSAGRNQKQKAAELPVASDPRRLCYGTGQCRGQPRANHRTAKRPAPAAHQLTERTHPGRLGPLTNANGTRQPDHRPTTGKGSHDLRIHPHQSGQQRQRRDQQRPFWPVIKLADLRAIMRTDGTITTERLRHAVIDAIAAVNSDLSSWAINRRGDGYTRTGRRAIRASPPNPCWCWYRRAVYSMARANPIRALPRQHSHC